MSSSASSGPGDPGFPGVPGVPGGRVWRGVIGEFGASVPEIAAGSVVTLGEGGTPLLPAPVLSELTGCQVHLKIEGMNPTGSFKDRGMVVAVAKALEEGAQAIICASTGNTAASAAAYGAPAQVEAAERRLARVEAGRWAPRDPRTRAAKRPTPWN